MCLSYGFAVQKNQAVQTLLRNGRKPRSLVCVWLLVLLSLASCTRHDAEGFIFTYAQEQPGNSLRGQSMTFFKSELEKRSNGRIRVELYFGGVLGTERELMDFVATGAIQGTRGGYFADANPKFNILTMPFFVDGWDEAIRLVNSDFMQSINEGALYFENQWTI